jgi:hypothetical protein
LVDRATRTNRYDLNYGAGDSVDNPKTADPAAAQTGELVAELLADGGIFGDVSQCGTNSSLQVRVEASDQRRDVVGYFQTAHDDRGGSIGE